MHNIEFSLNTISYLENRISLVDNKSSILLAVHTLFIGFITYLIKEYLLSSSVYFNRGCYYFLGLSVLIFLVSIFYLLQTIRPSNLFSNRVKKDRYENKLMWLSEKENLGIDELIEVLKNNNEETFLISLAKTHHTCLQLMKLKYKYYRISIYLTKICLIINSIGLLFLLLLKP